MANITDEIKDRCNIADVVGRYVRLKRAGSGYMGLCPFHSEKTPSFSVSESRQSFHCFGCGEGGDVISFVMKIEHLDFMSAVKKLADESGIRLEDFGYKKRGGNDALYEINREAAVFFNRQLTGRPNPGLDYVRRRGLKDSTLRRFGMGYAEDSWDSLKQHLESKGFTEKQMLTAGLMSSSRGNVYDKFRDRVIFPIINTRKKVIGFGGRSVGGGEPKYLNSPESPVFLKKNNLFGINLTGKEISDSDLAIVVEGYMDLVSLYEYGVRNVVATLGTSLTENQCRMISRYTKNAVLSYDSDAAGRKAALRGIELMRAAGLEARVLHVADGKDPDEFIRKNGRDAYADLVKSAAYYGEYVIDYVKSSYGGNISGDRDREKFLSEVSGRLSGRLRPAEEENIIKKLSDITGFSEGAVRREFDSHSGQRTGTAVSRVRDAAGRNGEKTAEALGRASQLEIDLIRLIIVKPELTEEIKKEENVFRSGTYHRIFLALSENYDAGTKEIYEPGVTDSLDPAEEACLRKERDFVQDNEELYGNPDKIFAECMLSIAMGNIGEKIELVSEMINNYPKAAEDGDRDKLEKLYSELNSLTLELQELRQKKG